MLIYPHHDVYYGDIMGFIDYNTMIAFISIISILGSLVFVTVIGTQIIEARHIERMRAKYGDI